MPTRNTRKYYTPDTYYHVYTRGVNKQAIFHDDNDYEVFLSLLERHLSPRPHKKANGQPALSFADSISLLCYCLMPNHVHFLLYQHEDELAIAQLLQRVFTSYSMYFNKKYERVGPLFQSRYLASMIDSDAYLHHISRYIHRNPHMWSEYRYSSLSDYLGNATRDWVKPEPILELFDSNPKKYLAFVEAMDDDDKESITDELAHG